MIKYDGLIKRLEDKGITKTTLCSELNISSRTVAKIAKGEKISNHVLSKIANYFKCDIDDLYRYVSSNKLLQSLKDEKDYKIKGGIYHELQVRMTYNSNHIEGSKLSVDETRMIFETRSLDINGSVRVDDIIETVNHFRAIDYVIDHAEESLNESHIKNLHRILKEGTKDSELNWFMVGDYKKRANVVGGKETASPKEVPILMKQLLLDYESKNEVCIEDIIEFHYRFESIHPFQDGNGRVGRLIALKECLRYDIVPFIIEDGYSKVAEPPIPLRVNQ